MCTQATAAAATDHDECVGNCGNCKTFIESKRQTAVIIVAPHATDKLPDELQAEYAGLSDTHFAIDIGTADLAAALAKETGARLVSGNVGRLGIDLNRALDDAFDADRPEGFGTVKSSRQHGALVGLYDAFHASVRSAVEMVARDGIKPVLIDLHSFSRTWRDQVRVVDIGVCDHRLDARAKDLLQSLHAEFGSTHTVMMDEPYPGTHPGAFIARHYYPITASALTIEICDDLIATAEGRAALLPGLSRAITHLATGEPSHVQSL